MSKKKLLSLALVVIMIATLSFSTLAWFTDVDDAENKFTVGGVGDGPNTEDKIFSVDVKENVDGEDQPVDNKEFKDVLPGGNYTKEAYVENTGSYDQYIRVVMTVTDWKAIKDIVTIKMDDAFDTNWETTGGGHVVDGVLKAHSNADAIDSKGNLVVTMYLNKKLEPGTRVDIMDYVEIAKTATQANFTSENFDDGFQITFKADAVQTENVLETYGTEEWKNARDSFAALEP